MNYTRSNHVGEFSDEELDALGDANLMLTAFNSVGVERFDETLLRRDYAPEFHGTKFILRIRESLPNWFRFYPRVSLVLSPRLPKNSDSLIVQLEDITQAALDRVRQYTFCVTEAAAGRFQAFIAVRDASRHAKDEVRRQLIESGDADRLATNAFRIAGSFNTKTKYQQTDGSFQRVRLVIVNHGRQVTVDELIAAGLLPSPPRPHRRAAPAAARRTPPMGHRIGSRIVPRLPRYGKTLADTPAKEDGTSDRSKADLFFARTCLFYWEPPLSREETIKLLLKHSEKAKEQRNPRGYAESKVDAAIRLFSPGKLS